LRKCKEYNRKKNKRLARLAFRFLIAFVLSSVIVTIIYAIVPVPYTQLMLKRLIEQKANNKELKLQKTWVPIEDISDNMIMAVIASEDQKFPDHYGFDWQSIKEAHLEKKEGKRFRGGSTISQQTAKNVFLWNKKSYIRKGLEVWFTLLIETIWGKERIMEIYLNVAEFGDGIYGVEAASQYYFHKPSEKLSKNEAALLAAILPNPRRWNPSKPTRYLYNRQNWIVGQINNLAKPDFLLEK